MQIPVNVLQNNDISENPMELTKNISNKTAFIDIFQNSRDSGIIIVDHLNNIVKEIAKESSIYDLIGFSIGMVIYGIFVYHFYRFLSKRDLFSINLEQRIAHGKFKATGEKTSTAPRVIAYIATNFFIFPFVVFLWFLGYSSFMFLLVQQMSTATIFLVSSSLIIAIRISAYYNEDLSRDLAKLLPFALLGIFLINPQFYSINEIMHRLEEMRSFIIQIASFIMVAMAVEITLSLLYLIKIKFVHKKEKPSKIDDSESPI